MKEYFNFLGFKINTKNFLITLGVFSAIVVALVLVDLFFFKVSWYGFLIGCAFLLAVVISGELMPERGLKKDFSYDLIWWIFPLSIIGARIAFVANNVELYSNFWEMCAVWEGGLSIWGGVMGGAIGLCICCAIKKVNPLCAMDCVVPVLILGQAIGRWGNFANAEVYGWEITNDAFKWFPFGVNINGTWHLANFFYESVLDLAGFFGLLFLLRKCKRKGVPTTSYLMFYGFIRFFLEDLRDPQFIMRIPGTNIPWSKLTSGIMFGIGLIGFIAIMVVAYLHKKNGTNLLLENSQENSNVVKKAEEVTLNENAEANEVVDELEEVETTETKNEPLEKDSTKTEKKE